MEIACVMEGRLAAPVRPGRPGGARPGRDVLPDPVEAAELTEAMARALEGIGAAVEAERRGELYFALDGLRRLYGGTGGALAAARRATAAALGSEPRLALAPTRFAAYAAAASETGKRGPAAVAPARLGAFLAPLPVGLLADRVGRGDEEGDALVIALERLGIETLGELARVAADQVSDRFGRLGLRALALARGEDEPLRPRQPHEDLAEQVELPEGVAGSQLECALALLVDRLLALPQRRGRTLLGLRLGARLCAGGSWSVEQGLGRPSASARVLRSLLVPRLQALPGPASALRLRALGLGPPEGDQLVLAVGGGEPRRRRLGEAVREVRAAQGSKALLKVLPVDSASRVPERWAVLTPFPEL
jgi:protein ImuB